MQLAPHLAQAIGCLLALLAVVGVGYQLYAIWAIRRYFAAPPVLCHDPLPVTLLKPLHGAEPRLAENLASFLATRHAGPVQMVCGVNTPEDTAVPAARALIASHRQADIALWEGPRAPGANGKIGNLVAMAPLARHDILILSDSDMVVGPDYLPAVLGALAQPGVGAVSCLYVGRGDAGLWSQIGAAMIAFGQTPNMIVAVAGGLARPCMGSTIAIRRETLEAIGGFGRFADVLADDYAIGEAVTELGLAIAIPPILLDHAGAEATFPELWRHFLRWAVTIRDLRPAGYVGSVVTSPLPLALLAMIALPATGAALVAAALAARLGVAYTMRRAAGRACAPLWCIAIGDILGFIVYGASLLARNIDWRGTRLVTAPHGRISAQTD